ncbi:MAG: ABC transporter ATP-binding protein [Rubrivivax sp.]
MALLDIQGLSIDIPLDHGTLSAVRDVDLAVDKGECLGVVGESGSGKSLTALSILKLLPRRAVRRARRLALGSDDLLAMDETQLARRIRGRRVGFVFQEPMTSLNPVYTIGRQLTETMRLHGTATPDQARRRAVELLERVGIPGAERRLSSYPHELSGGQRQRVVIAIALMNRPELLIADEPTTALDVTVQAQILALLAELQRESGMGLLLISHNLGAVSQVADRVAVMYAGEVVETAASAALFADPRHPYTKGLLGALPGAAHATPGQPLQTIRGVVKSFYAPPAACVFAGRCEFRTERCESARPPMLEPAPGHSSRCFFPAAGPVAETPAAPISRQRLTQDVVLEASGLAKAYRVRGGLFKPKAVLQAVRDVSLSVHAGETLAVVGESGCGKSTLARMLLGLESPDAGSVSVAGRGLMTLGRRERARLVQLVFQDPYASLNPSRSVRAIVRRPLDLAADGDRRTRDERVSALLDSVGLPRRLHDASAGQLSGGQRQRVAIARALVTSPRLIVCDEPTSALDVSVQAQILNLLLGLRERFGLSLVLISHDLAVVAHMADRIAVMYLGEIVEVGAAAEVLARPQHPYTRALLDATPRVDGGSELGQVRLQGYADPMQRPAGCAFSNRCPRAGDRCHHEAPVLRAVAGHRVSCHSPEQEASPAILPVA